MISYELLTPGLTVGMNQRMLIAAFLHKHLDEFGDEKEDILKCIDYIAMHKDYRGQGIGKQLMQKAIDSADGNIALHVEPENPAVHLYKKLGFTNKYLEMRLVKN